MKDLFTLAEEEDGDKDSSETQAIFAGTGSRINLKKIQARAEKARKEAKARAQGAPASSIPLLYVSKSINLLSMRFKIRC